MNIGIYIHIYITIDYHLRVHVVHARIQLLKILCTHKYMYIYSNTYKSTFVYIHTYIYILTCSCMLCMREFSCSRSDSILTLRFAKYVKRALHIPKETYTHTKETNTHAEETFKHQKRPTHAQERPTYTKRDLYTHKRDLPKPKETYAHTKGTAKN